MKFFFLQIIIVGFSFSLQGQHFTTHDLFLPGYIILNSGDTLRGKILEEKNTNKSTRCIFKEETPKSVYRQYLQPEIKSYRFLDAEYFVSRKLVVDSLEKV